jgi:hypothetical protein
MRSFALLDLGLCANSSASGRIGFFVTDRSVGTKPQTQTGKSGGHVQPFSLLAIALLTSLSSSD